MLGYLGRALHTVGCVSFSISQQAKGALEVVPQVASMCLARDYCYVTQEQGPSLAGSLGANASSS